MGNRRKGRPVILNSECWGVGRRGIGARGGLEVERVGKGVTRVVVSEQVKMVCRGLA